MPTSKSSRIAILVLSGIVLAGCTNSSNSAEGPPPAAGSDTSSASASGPTTNGTDGPSEAPDDSARAETASTPAKVETSASDSTEETSDADGPSTSGASSSAPPTGGDDKPTEAPKDSASAEAASREAEAADQPVATASPSTAKADSRASSKALEVQISSGTAAPNQPVEVVVVAPKNLGSQSVYFVSPTEDGSLMIVSIPMKLDKDLRAQATFSFDKTTTLRAVVLREAPPEDRALLPKDVERAAESPDFTITIS